MNENGTFEHAVGPPGLNGVVYEDGSVLMYLNRVKFNQCSLAALFKFDPNILLIRTFSQIYACTG